MVYIITAPFDRTTSDGRAVFLSENKEGETMSTRSFSRKRRNLWIINGVLFFLIIVALFFFFIIVNSENFSGNNTPAVAQVPIESAEPTPTPEPTPEPTPTPPPYFDAVWIGVGDIMSHTPQLPGAYNKETDSYDFMPYFEPITSLLDEGDWVMANLETPIAGKEIGYSGYPTFNAPIELAQALWDSGFNVLSTANNHSLDKGEKGILNTLENLHNIGFTTVGTASSTEDAEKITIIDHNDIKMGFLSYTYGTNGIPIPQGKPYLINLIDKEAIIADMTKLRDAGADVITIALHFGIEYQIAPSEEQKKLARELIAAGADIIAGSHPHVLQPYELLSSYDENGNERQGLIIYSMGNFISNQRGNSKDYGAIFQVNIRKHNDTGAIEFTDVVVTPTWVQRYKSDSNYRYRILPVEATLAERNDTLLTNSDYSTLESDFAMLTKRLTSMQTTKQ